MLSGIMNHKFDFESLCTRLELPEENVIVQYVLPLLNNGIAVLSSPEIINDLDSLLLP